MPLTPAGNPTERHIVRAYIEAAKRLVPDTTAFWTEKLGAPPQEDPAAFQNQIRGRLMKKGGAGYIEPDPDSFPSVEEVNALTVACGAIPCAAWLDGTTEGEKAMGELLALLMDKGVCALNIVPDRNWNIKDETERAVKTRNLNEVIELAKSLDLPVLGGTEMNSPGQKFVDDFSSAALSPHLDVFLDGGYFIYGHTVMERRLGMGYQSEWADTSLPGRRDKNAFYAEAGRLIEPGDAGRTQIDSLSPAMTPKEILSRLNK